ncbi:hypothetical protein CEXT_583121 [Caerostris extrusa]|uniref:Uncharacterized protein n=1 Tax=Caerostris extrusa TaxID=172846 RepID=A0AAV4VQR9_CAEEX|nr:hypothetical protein CEXT_583121 [Caerostris extrusa]
MSKVPRRRKCRRCFYYASDREEFSCHLAICHVICGAKRSVLPARPPNINLLCLRHWRDSELLWKLWNVEITRLLNLTDSRLLVIVKDEMAELNHYVFRGGLEKSCLDMFVQRKVKKMWWMQDLFERIVVFKWNVQITRLLNVTDSSRLMASLVIVKDEMADLNHVINTTRMSKKTTRNSSPSLLGEEFAASSQKAHWYSVISFFHVKKVRRRKCRRVLLRVGQVEFSCHAADAMHVICGAKRSALPARLEH